MHEKVEMNDHYLDEIVHNNNSYMDLAMQSISIDKTVKNDAMQDWRNFNSQSLTTQVKKAEQLVSLMPAIEKAFNLLGDDIVELPTENDALKNKIGDYDKKWLQESKERLLKQIDDEKRAYFIMYRKKKQLEKLYINGF